MWHMQNGVSASSPSQPTNDADEADNNSMKPHRKIGQQQQQQQHDNAPLQTSGGTSRERPHWEQSSPARHAAVVSSSSSRRYSATSSSGRPTYQVATPSSPGVFGANDKQQHNASSIWPPETPTQQRDRQVQQLKLELSQAYDRTIPPATGEVVSSSSFEFKVDENAERGNWSGRLDFLLSCIGYAVGLGNVWRFPYMCFINGGGAFLIPYVIFLLLCGIPVFLLDLSLGQFSSEGPATCWEFAPIFNGVGFAMTFLSTVVAIYYNLIIAYALYYLFASMTSRLPWSSCDNAWNTELCSHRMPLVQRCIDSNRQLNGTCYNGTKFLGIYNETLFTLVTSLRRILPADEYYNHEVLKASSGIHDIGAPDWKLVLCLLASWIIVFCCMVKGIKTTGKVVYFTSLFPYVVLLILFFRGVTLSNAGEGIKFYILPDFSRLASADVWKDAAGQIFFSLSCSWGGLISLASYNRFHNNVIRDTFVVCLANCGTSIFAGFVIFSYIGHLAGNLGVPVKDVSKSGFGLAFIIYPEAVNLLPGSSFWAILFFIMLLTLGVDSQFAMVETLITSICDQFRSLRRYKPPLIGCICFVLFLLGLPCTCRGGTYLMEIIDSYSGSWTILLIGLFECISIGWVYGRPGIGRFHRFSEDIALIMRKPIWPIWRYLWQFVSPALIFGIILFNWAKYSRTEYSPKGSGNFYPVWADAIGWLIAITSVVIIIGTGVVKLLMEPAGSPLRQRLLNLSIPSYKWGPSLPKHRLLMAPYMERLDALKHFYLNPAKLIKYSDVFPLDEGHNSPKPDDHVNQQQGATETHTNEGFLGNSTNTISGANTGSTTDV